MKESSISDSRAEISRGSSAKALSAYEKILRKQAVKGKEKAPGKTVSDPDPGSLRYLFSIFSFFQ